MYDVVCKRLYLHDAYQLQLFHEIKATDKNCGLEFAVNFLQKIDESKIFFVKYDLF